MQTGTWGAHRASNDTDIFRLDEMAGSPPAPRARMVLWGLPLHYPHGATSGGNEIRLGEPRRAKGRRIEDTPPRSRGHPAPRLARDVGIPGPGHIRFMQNVMSL